MSEWAAPSTDRVEREKYNASHGWAPPAMLQPEPAAWETTELYEMHQNRVVKGRPNDLVIALTASSRTGVSGTGKTTASTSIAEEFDITDGGYDAEAHGAIDASDFAYDVLLNAPEGSSVVLEEAQGTPSGTGLNKRRGMKEETIDAINGILANRDNRYTVIIVAQQLSYLDSSLLPLIDCWLLIRYGPDHRKGPMMSHYGLQVDDFDLKNPDLETPGREDLRWPELPADNQNYAIMEEKKQVAKDKYSNEEEEEEELPLEAQAELAVALKKLNDAPWTDVTDLSDRLTYSREYLRQEAHEQELL